MMISSLQSQHRTAPLARHQEARALRQAAQRAAELVGQAHTAEAFAT